MAYYVNPLLLDIDWLEWHFDAKNYRYICVATHREIKIIDFLDKADCPSLIKITDFIKRLRKEVDIYLNQLWC